MEGSGLIKRQEGVEGTEKIKETNREEEMEEVGTRIDGTAGKKGEKEIVERKKKTKDKSWKKKEKKRSKN